MNLSITTKDTHLDAIIASYLDEKYELSEFQKEMKKRIKTAFSLLLNWRSRDQAAQIIKDEFDVSTATAYRDISRALIVYGDINQAEKDGWRFVIMEYNHKLLQLATKEKNLTEMGRALDRMIKLAQLDKEETILNLEKIANMQIEIAIDKATQKKFDDMGSGGVVDFNNWQDTEDADFEEVEEEGDED